MPTSANTSPLVLYARIHRLDLLRDLFEAIWIPPAVAREAYLDHPTRPGAAALARIAGSWLRVVEAGGVEHIRQRFTRLDPGETEAIALAAEHGLLLVIDDLRGRRASEHLGLQFIGSAGLLVLAKTRGYIKQVRPLLDELVHEGLRLSDVARGRVLAQAGESVT